MNDKEWKEYRRMAENDESPEVKTSDVLALLDERDAFRNAAWLASVVWLHYKDRTDLDPVQKKHLELAIKARGALAAIGQ